MYKKQFFPSGSIFHICNKSIANFRIFNNNENSQRFLLTLDYYNNQFSVLSLSKFLQKNQISNFELIQNTNKNYLKFIAYKIMPDHYHLLISSFYDNIIPKYINNIENSYTRFFNIKYNRKGPLWQSRFHAIRIKTNEQLLHVTRYIHLNSTTANLTKKPEDWNYSSYNFYLKNNNLKNYLPEISISNPQEYKKFINDQIDYQKKLKKINKFLLE